MAKRALTSPQTVVTFSENETVTRLLCPVAPICSAIALLGAMLAANVPDADTTNLDMKLNLNHAFG